MKKPANFRDISCNACRNGKSLGFDFSMAFQPIVDISSHSVFAQEALVRGIGDQPAGKVFEKVNDENLYAFDQACRVKAIELAAKLNISSLLSINFLPNAVYKPELCIRTTLEAAKQFDFPINQIMFEVTEGEKVSDIEHLQSILTYYNDQGFITALDDFGAGYSGLNMLAGLDIGVLKLDMDLIRNINKSDRKHAVIRGIVATCDELNIPIIAEGVETKNEFVALRALGINLYQGFLFARPAYEALAKINWSVAAE